MADWQELSTRAGLAFDEGMFDEACNLAEELRRLHPDSGMAYQILGMTEILRDQPYKAIDLLSHALALNPGLVPARCQLGVAHSMLSKPFDALQCFETALRLQPDHIASRFNRAQMWLQTGNFRDGWLEYEWRWKTGEVARPNIPRPNWDGRPVCGRSILVHTEQGIGDSLQFVRLLALLKERGARVVFACQTPLHEFLKHLKWVDEWFPIDKEAPISFEWCCPLLSLPGLLGIDRECDIPAMAPYLSADPQRVEYWRSKIAALPGLKIGLNWQGKPSQARDRLRSIALEKFAPIASLPDVALLSLHKGVGEPQIDANRQRVPLTVFDDMDADAPFVDTAAIMMNLDLIITTDTSTLHLAGALGRPVWVPLTTACDWRFLYERTDSPWYPTMRLFRQQTFNVWEPVIDEMAAALRTFREERSPKTDPVTVNRPDASTNGLPMSPISVGELLDKITILEIKSERIRDSEKLANVRRELDLLREIKQTRVNGHFRIDELILELKQVNEQLWEIEDEIRQCEKENDFGKRFIELARAVYQTNDRRAELKQQMNETTGSELVEEKSYDRR